MLNRTEEALQYFYEQYPDPKERPETFLDHNGYIRWNDGEILTSQEEYEQRELEGRCLGDE